MVVLSKTSGSNWNSEEDLRNAFSEFAQVEHGDDGGYIYSATLINESLSKAQSLMEAMIRKHWDVDDDTYFSAANIGTHAPAVKAIHLQWAAGVALIRGIGKNLRGASAEYAKYLIDDAKEDLVALIEAGALGVGRRTDDPDSIQVHAGSQGASTPFFTRDDETNWPRTSSTGTTDNDPY